MATQFEIRGTNTIRDNWLRAVRNGLARLGIDANVTPGSDWYILGEAFGNQLETAEANASIKADEALPDTATGDDLIRQAAVFNVVERDAGGSSGPIIFDTAATGTTAISAGAKLIDGAGLQFAVVTTGNYLDGDSITVQALSTGEATNHDVGDVLRWVSAPASANEKALVGAGGLVNGVDADDEAILRARLFAVLQNPPASGNAQHVVEIALAASATVQAGFVFPAIQGAGSTHVAVTATPTSTSKSRVVTPAIVSGTIAPYIQGQLPEHVYSVITSVADVNTDVAFGLVLPEAPTAAPPGAGGGWTDGVPWPAPDASSTWRCTVTAVSSSTVFTVDATTTPNPLITNVSWVSPTDWRLYQAKVISYTGTSGAYQITIDMPFANIAAGSYIWPTCQNAQSYVDAVIEAYSLLGPGEKTSNASALIRGFRHPRPAASWPMTLGGSLTAAIVAGAPQGEVQSAQFFHRTDGTTTLTGAAGLVTPQLPAAITDAPKIFIPHHIAFYRVP